MSFITRYRNASILFTLLLGQVILLGYQVRRDDGMLLVRAWTVGAISPLNKGLHAAFDLVFGSWHRYVWLVGAREENEGLRHELDRLRLEKEALQRDLERYARTQNLVAYREQIASQTLLAEVIGGGASSNSREIILDRGRDARIAAGMAVITADGIVGKVEAAYPGSAFVELINDPDAAVGVLLGDSRVRGVLQGRGSEGCFLAYIPTEVEVRAGEPVYTSGEDRVYPKGLPVGEIVRLGEHKEFLEIWVRPYASLDRLDEVLVVLEGVHQELPDRPEPQLPESLLESPATPAPAGGVAVAPAPPPSGSETDADRLRLQYQAIQATHGRPFGDSRPGEAPPDFNAGYEPPAEALTGGAPPAEAVAASGSAPATHE